METGSAQERRVAATREGQHAAAIRGFARSFLNKGSKRWVSARARRGELSELELGCENEIGWPAPRAIAPASADTHLMKQELEINRKPAETMDPVPERAARCG